MEGVGQIVVRGPFCKKSSGRGRERDGPEADVIRTDPETSQRVVQGTELRLGGG